MLDIQLSEFREVVLSSFNCSDLNNSPNHDARQIRMVDMGTDTYVLQLRQ